MEGISVKTKYRVLLQCTTSLGVTFVMPTMIEAYNENEAAGGSIRYVLQHGGQLTLFKDQPPVHVNVAFALAVSVDAQPGIVRAFGQVRAM